MLAAGGHRKWLRTSTTRIENSHESMCSKRNPVHLRVTLKDVLAASNSVKGMIESITTEFSKRIREKADEVSDSRDGS
jgi:hypothetical protein